MDHSELQKLIELMNDNDLLELELEEEGKKVRLKKKPPPGERDAPLMMAAPAPMQMSGAMPGPPGTAAAAEPEDKGLDPNAVTINSPMVGTFYRATSPDADELVSVGDEVNPESVTCIIEAMKVMNEIKAEISGKIVEVLVQNGEPVEFGQPLFAVQPL